MERITSIGANQRTVASAGIGRVSRMPAFSAGTEAHSHSVHSALATLAALGVSAHRISILRTGREAAMPGTVVRQAPAAGTPLLPDSAVRLHVAGLGFTHALPVGMWDSGGETHAGTRELLEPLDDPLEKLKHWFHEGAPLFRIAADDLQSCARWLRLFGIAPEVWPRALWFPLASLLAGMPRHSCSQDGCALVLSNLLGLPVQSFTYQPCFHTLPEGALSNLGARASRLGVDLLVGDAIEDLASLEIEIGPVALDVYERFSEQPEGVALLHQTLDLLLPLSTSYAVRWSVLDKSRAPRLGERDGNSRLGISSHMGLEAMPVNVSPDTAKNASNLSQQEPSWSHA